MVRRQSSQTAATSGQVRELDPARRLVWDGPAHGIHGVHVWDLVEEDGATLVRSEES